MITTIKKYMFFNIIFLSTIRHYLSSTTVNTTPSMYPTKCTPFTTITSRRWRCPWLRRWRLLSMCPSTRKYMCPLLRRCMCQCMSITRSNIITLKKITTITTRAAGIRGEWVEALTHAGVAGGNALVTILVICYIKIWIHMYIYARI